MSVADGATRTFWNLRIPARDGVGLAADVLLPPGCGPFPAVVLRTPYVRSRTLNNARGWIRLVDYGYALVTVDVRGRNDSEGEWTPFVRDPQDAHDVIEWVAKQPWCTGKVGMVGGSYEGLTQLWTLIEPPKHLACVVPMCVGAVRHQLPFAIGVPMQYWLWWMNLVLGKTQQFSGAPNWESHIEHIPLTTLDRAFGLSHSAWRRYVGGEIEFFSDARALTDVEYQSIQIPVLIGVGWWDDQETMLTWQALQQARSASECRLLIGAWDHAGNVSPRPMLGGVDVSTSVMDTIAYTEQFLALHLKGHRTAMADAPRCRVFRTGENSWDLIDQWPDPTAVERTLFLSSDGDARTLRGSGRLLTTPDVATGSDTYIYDPNKPAREMSSLAIFAWADPPLDNRYLHRRNDVLVYDSLPLHESLFVSGRYRACVYIASDRPDTDIYVGLCDVDPDGRAIGLCATNEISAGMRLRYRNGPKAELLQVGEIYEVTILGTWLHHTFKRGHQVRVTISSERFPITVRNAGTGNHWAVDEELYPQRNTVHHSTQFPSRVMLPVVPGNAR